MERVEFDLEEYRALRSEIIQSMDDANKIMSFGMAAVGLVLTAGLSHKDNMLGFMVVGLFLPVLSALVLSMWFGPLQQIARASYYLSGLEARIKSACSDAGSVSWEVWLRGRKPGGDSKHFWSIAQAGIGLFIVIIIFSILMGFTAGGSIVDAKTRGWIIAVTVIICGALLFNVIRRYRQWKYWLSTYYALET